MIRWANRVGVALLAGASLSGSPAPVAHDCDPILIDLTTISAAEPVEVEPKERSVVAAGGLRAYVGTADATKLAKIDLADPTAPAEEVTLSTRADLLATADGGETLLAADQEANTISKVDPETGATLTSVTLASQPTNLEVSSDGTRLFITREGLSAVEVRDAVTLQLVSTVTMTGDPTAIAALSDPDKVVVTLSTGTIALVDLSTMTVTQTGVLGADLTSVSPCDPPQDTALVTDRDTKTLMAVETEGMTLADAVGTSVTEPRQVEAGVKVDTGATTPDAEFAFVIGSESFVSVVDCREESPDFGREVCQMVLAGRPAEVTVDRTGGAAANRVVVGTTDRRRVVVVDPECFVEAPHIVALSRAAGVPGSILTVTGAGLQNARFVVSDGTTALFYVSPISVSPDGTSARFMAPLDLPPTMNFLISATPSSEAAVIANQTYIRCTPKAFRTLAVDEALRTLIAQVRGFLAQAGISNQARSRVQNAVRRLEDALHQFDQGRFQFGQGELRAAFEHLLAMMDHIEGAVEQLNAAAERGVDVEDSPLKAAEIVQYAAYLLIADFIRDAGLPEAIAEELRIAFEAAQLGLVSSVTGADFRNALGEFQQLLNRLRSLEGIPFTLSPYDERRLPPTRPPGPPHEPERPSSPPCPWTVRILTRYLWIPNTPIGDPNVTYFAEDTGEIVASATLLGAALANGPGVFAQSRAYHDQPLGIMDPARIAALQGVPNRVESNMSTITVVEVSRDGGTAAWEVSALAHGSIFARVLPFGMIAPSGVPVVHKGDGDVAAAATGDLSYEDRASVDCTDSFCVETDADGEVTNRAVLGRVAIRARDRNGLVGPSVTVVLDSTAFTGAQVHRGYVENVSGEAMSRCAHTLHVSGTDSSGCRIRVALISTGGMNPVYGPRRQIVRVRRGPSAYADVEIVGDGEAQRFRLVHAPPDSGQDSVEADPIPEIVWGREE